MRLFKNRMQRSSPIPTRIHRAPRRPPWTLRTTPRRAARRAARRLIPRSRHVRRQEGTLLPRGSQLRTSIRISVVMTWIRVSVVVTWIRVSVVVTWIRVSVVVNSIRVAVQRGCGTHGRHLRFSDLWEERRGGFLAVMVGGGRFVGWCRSGIVEPGDFGVRSSTVLGALGSARAEGGFALLTAAQEEDDCEDDEDGAGGYTRGYACHGTALESAGVGWRCIG